VPVALVGCTKGNEFTRDAHGLHRFATDDFVRRVEHEIVVTQVAH